MAVTTKGCVIKAFVRCLAQSLVPEHDLTATNSPFLLPLTLATASVTAASLYSSLRLSETTAQLAEAEYRVTLQPDPSRVGHHTLSP